MELNGVRLFWKDSKFCLAVSRFPRDYESPKLDYKGLFKSIGVNMVNFEDLLERERFKKQVSDRFKSFKW